MIEVVFGPFWVWLFLGETIGGYTLLGGSVLLLAITGNALSGLRTKTDAFDLIALGIWPEKLTDLFESFPN